MLRPDCKWYPRFQGEGVFSVIIPTWNNLKCLQLAIRSLRENSRHRHQIIVFVNEGKDGSLDWLLAQEDIDVLYSPENLGICWAMNLAAAQVKTDYIAYMNDDMYACPDWDLALEAEIRQIGHPWFYISATLIEPYETGNHCVLVRDFGTNPENFQESALIKALPDLHFEDWMGSTWPLSIVHKQVWQLVGGYSIEFSPGMYSDPDFSMKLWQLGIRYFKGIGQSKIYHFSSRSTGRIKRNGGRYQFLRKWGMPSSYFYRKFLKLGQAFHGPASETTLNWRQKKIFRFKLIWESLIQ